MGARVHRPAGAAHPAADAPTWATLFAITEGAVITGVGFFLGAMVFAESVRRRRAKP